MCAFAQVSRTVSSFCFSKVGTILPTNRVKCLWYVQYLTYNVRLQVENWGPEGVSDGRGQYLPGHRTGRYSIWLGTHGSLGRSGDGPRGLWNSCIICRMDMSVMCFFWSMCLLFTWTALRGPGYKKGCFLLKGQLDFFCPKCLDSHLSVFSAIPLPSTHLLP